MSLDDAIAKARTSQKETDDHARRLAESQAYALTLRGQFDAAAREAARRFFDASIPTIPIIFRDGYAKSSWPLGAPIRVTGKRGWAVGELCLLTTDGLFNRVELLRRASGVEAAAEARQAGVKKGGLFALTREPWERWGAAHFPFGGGGFHHNALTISRVDSDTSDLDAMEFLGHAVIRLLGDRA